MDCWGIDMRNCPRSIPPASLLAEARIPSSTTTRNEHELHRAELRSSPLSAWAALARAALEMTSSTSTAPRKLYDLETSTERAKHTQMPG